MNNIFKNPYLNSVYAEAYIFIVAFVMRHVGKPDTPDNFFTPIAALSLLVLSAVIMAFLFGGEPLQLYIDDNKKQALTFFMKTLLTFAGITAVALIVLSVSMR